MSINTIKSLITSGGGLARPNKFNIELPSIPGNSMSARDLSVLCRSASLPSKQISTDERRIGMTTEKIAYGYIVDDVSINFLVLNDYKVKKYFEDWKDLIIDEETHTVGYKTDYQKRVVIHQLGTSVPSITASLGAKVGPISKNLGSFAYAPFPQVQVTTPVYSVELINAYPITTNAIEFNNDADAFLEMDVQFAYTSWRVIQSSQQTINIDLPGGFQFEATN